MVKKTNAMRLLDANKIKYQSVSYHFDEDQLDLITIAEINQIDVKIIFKTLVLTDDKGNLVVALLAGDELLSFKKLAQLIPCKNLSLLPVDQLLKHTGYLRGGCSPIGMKKKYPVFISKSALGHKEILLNAGQKGLLFSADLSILIHTFGWIISDISVS